MPTRLSVAAIGENDSVLDTSVHVGTPVYPSYRESGIRADVADAVCACPMCCGGLTFSGPQAFMPPQSGVAGNGLPIYNWNQAAAQIARDSTGWGAGAVVTYGFRASEPAAMPAGVSGFVAFNSAQIAVAIESLSLWSEVANITFLRVQDETGYTNNATMLFANYTTGADGASAFAYYPGSTSASALAGDVWINFSLATNNSNLIEGAFGPHTMAHEIGHAIGLAHPADYDALNAVDPTYPESAVYWQDSRMYTVMSYFGSAGPGGSLGAFASGPQLHDIAAAQLLYGANMTTRTGDTVYGFNSNTGHAHFTITADEQTPVFAIWDAGGNDTIDLSGYSTAVEIDLREEAFSSAGPGTNPAIAGGRAYGNISIARGAVIENGIGGGGADTLIGNAVNNVFTGNGGNDQISGGAGIDRSGYSIASTSATWTRSPDGTWTVSGQGSDTLTSVEFLDFTDRDVFLDRAFATFTGDGTSDVLFHGVNGQVIRWNVLGTTLQDGSYIASVLPSDWTALGIGDFNGDGRDDVVWRQSNGQVLSWQMNGSAISSAQSLASLGAEWSFLAVADLSGDLRDDVVWRNTSSGLIYSWETSASGALASGGGIAILGAEWNLEGIGDFDSDGRDDFLWRNSNSSQLVMWDMDGRAIAAGASTSAQVGAEWDVQGIGDFNGDGRDDILWMNTGGAVVIWHMNAATLLGGGYVASVDPNEWSIVNIGDYNGDGRDDILWQNSSGTVFDWIMNGTSITTAGALASIAPGQWEIIGGG